MLNIKQIKRELSDSREWDVIPPPREMARPGLGLVGEKVFDLRRVGVTVVPATVRGWSAVERRGAGGSQIDGLEKAILRQNTPKPW